jgi:hypothetical protein
MFATRRGFQKLTLSVQRERAPQRLCFPFGGTAGRGGTTQTGPAARGVSKGLTKVGVVEGALAD